MEISTTSTEDLKQHLTEITAEKALRREHGESGDNEYLAAMSLGGLDLHEKYIKSEINRREAGPYVRAYFN